LPSRTSPFTLTISVKPRLAPHSLAMSRMGRLVIPAMGASSRLFFKVNEPIVRRLSIGFIS
jgi:hypothetical protein